MTADARLLAGLAAELQRAAGLAERLEPLLAAPAGPAPDAARMADAQGLDLLRQTLEALAALAQDLAGGAAPEAALEAVPLADLAARLRAALAGDKAVEPAPASGAGDLLLFDDAP